MLRATRATAPKDQLYLCVISMSMPGSPLFVAVSTLPSSMIIIISLIAKSPRRPSGVTRHCVHSVRIATHNS